MARHCYRVTRRLPWIEGGRLGPDLDWIGGTGVVYEPGQTIVVDDREVSAILHCLEPIDDDGRAVLEATRVARATGAKRTRLADVLPNDRAWLVRATDESLRQQGCFQELVLRVLARGDRPSGDDLIAALRMDELPPKALIEYVVKTLTRPQRPGPRRPRRTVWQDLAIKAYYHYQLGMARHAHEVNSRQSRAIADVAKRATAKTFSVSKRTVERILACVPKALPIGGHDVPTS